MPQTSKNKVCLIGSDKNQQLISVTSSVHHNTFPFIFLLHLQYIAILHFMICNLFCREFDS